MAAQHLISSPAQEVHGLLKLCAVDEGPAKAHNGPKRQAILLLQLPVHLSLIDTTFAVADGSA